MHRRRHHDDFRDVELHMELQLLEDGVVERPGSVPNPEDTGDREPRPKILTPQVPGTRPNRCAPLIRCEFYAPNGPKGSFSAAEPRQIMVRVERP